MAKPSPSSLPRLRAAFRQGGFRAGDKMEAAGLIRALRAGGAGSAEVAFIDQPQPRHDGVGAFGQALDHLAEQVLHRPFRRDFQEEIPQGIKLGLIIER